MARRTALTFLSACTLSLASAAFAESGLIPVSIRSGPLAYSLQSLQRETGIELLFDRALVNGVQAPAVDDNLTIEAALRQLLADTDLRIRRARSGAWIIEQPDTPPLAQPDAAVPEVMVVGQHTQNADIRRFENDIQPYVIATREQLLDAHRDTVDQYFSSFVTANTQVVPSRLARNATPLSEINLRGLGTQDTLVLIDGRRLPGTPVSVTEFGQTDVNAIPLHAIERIEVLTGTAGGIYGYGALGGVVNVILDHEHRGFDVHLTGGISSRGDAGREAVEASYGHTSEDGRTDVTLFAAHSRTDALLAGERSYATRDRVLNARVYGEVILNNEGHGYSVGVRSLGSSLVFKPEFGGATLPSTHTFLPGGFSGRAAELTAALTQNAGKIDDRLADGDKRVALDTNPRSESLLANLRHRFDNGLEAYADVLVFNTRAQFTDGRSNNEGLMSPTSPANPFTDYVQIDYPVPDMDRRIARRVENARYTAGVQGGLPYGWRGTAEVTQASIHHTSISFTPISLDAGVYLFGTPSDPDVNPLGDWNTFQRYLAATDIERYRAEYSFRNRLRDASLRLAGPVFSTTEGPATLTLLAERRTEEVPATRLWKNDEIDGVTTTTSSNIFDYSNATTSFYAELRSRLLGTNEAIPLLRGLELQLAVRREILTVDFPRTPGGDDENGRVNLTFAGTAYTSGAKITPWPWLMLRASYATGEQPPGLLGLSEVEDVTTTLPLADPKRGGTDLGTEGAFLFRTAGNRNLKTARASTLALGAMFTPFGEESARLGIDYSRIRRTRDHLMFSSLDVILAHEDYWPERVTRAPLTDEDRAKGYTGGRVTALDARDTNGAGVDVDTLDGHFAWPLHFRDGRLQLHADATYHMSNRQKALFQPDVQTAGYRIGPLKWRTNGGVDWSTQRLTLSANAQYFGSYLVTQQGANAPMNSYAIQVQGASRIPSQTYVDLQATLRLSTRYSSQPDDLTLSFGIVNVLDATPPFESSLLPSALDAPGYSRYADPRQRRFELAVSQRF